MNVGQSCKFTNFKTLCMLEIERLEKIYIEKLKFNVNNN